MKGMMNMIVFKGEALIALGIVFLFFALFFLVALLFAAYYYIKDLLKKSFHKKGE